MDNVVLGTVTATGANIDIDLGWIPDVVEVMNITDTGNVHPELRWNSSMAAGAAIKRKGSTFTRISTLGITALGALGGTDTKRGFRIGTDADVNVNTNVLAYRAFRSVEPKR